MRYYLLLGMIAACVVALPHGLSAAEPGRPEQARPQPALVPELNVSNASLETIVQQLQDADPNLKVLVARPPGASADYPQVTLKLKNATTYDVLRLIALAYSLDLEQVSSQGGGSLFVLRVADPAQAKPRQEVVVFDLAPIVNKLAHEAPNGNAEKAHGEALNKALSLIQTVADMDGPPEPTLKIHDDTSTLIVKANRDQLAAIRSAIEALSPNKAGIGQAFWPGGNAEDPGQFDGAQAGELQNRMRALGDQMRRYRMGAAIQPAADAPVPPVPPSVPGDFAPTSAGH